MINEYVRNTLAYTRILRPHFANRLYTVSIIHHIGNRNKLVDTDGEQAGKDQTILVLMFLIHNWIALTRWDKPMYSNPSFMRFH